jgi:glycosyltransferase involved in cell wall biosynthesis
MVVLCTKGARNPLYLNTMISVVILTHNNQEMIADVLDSLKWCDERIIVDDHSTDKTLEYVKPYDVTIFQHDLHDDFAAQRNFGLSKAKGEWVLFVDSDELVQSILRDEIIKATKNNSTIVGYYISRKDFLFGRELKHGETAHVRLLRLAKKDAGSWKRNVHEVWDIHGSVASLTTPLLHYPHPRVSQFLAEINWYTTINAKVFFDEGVRTNVWQIILYPKAKFIQNYFFRLGFLDGAAGFVIAMMMSFHSFLTRSKLWELQHKKKTTL